MYGRCNTFAFRLAVALAGVLLTRTGAWADMSAPGITRGVVDYQVDFTGAFPDQRFVIYRHITLRSWDAGQGREVTANADEAEYVDPAAGPVRITHPPATANRVSFLIVSRAAVGSDRSALELGRAVLAGHVPGAARYDLPLTTEWPGWRRSRFVIEYQVRQAAGGEPELVRVSWEPLYQCWVVGIGLPGLIAAGGVWCFTRRWRGRAEPVALPDAGP